MVDVQRAGRYRQVGLFCRKVQFICHASSTWKKSSPITHITTRWPQFIWDLLTADMSEIGHFGTVQTAGPQIHPVNGFFKSQLDSKMYYFWIKIQLNTMLHKHWTLCIELCVRNSVIVSIGDYNCMSSEWERLFWSMLEIMLLHECNLWVKLPHIFSLSVTDPESELVAPAIVIGPKDTTVVAGSEATLECIANAR